jgi:carbonic anhydrase/acetyltransferase-like protein (isoleucine patch superfamily)
MILTPAPMTLHSAMTTSPVICDGAIIGPGAMIHGCHIGAGTIVEPGAIVCDGSVVGAACVVRAGAVVKQRSRFGDRVAIDGFPATEVERIDPPEQPTWALHIDDLPTPVTDHQSA